MAERKGWGGGALIAALSVMAVILLLLLFLGVQDRERSLQAQELALQSRRLARLSCGRTPS